MASLGYVLFHHFLKLCLLLLAASFLLSIHSCKLIDVGFLSGDLLRHLFYCKVLFFHLTLISWQLFLEKYLQISGLQVVMFHIRLLVIQKRLQLQDLLFLVMFVLSPLAHFIVRIVHNNLAFFSYWLRMGYFLLICIVALLTLLDRLNVLEVWLCA